MFDVIAYTRREAEAKASVYGGRSCLGAWVIVLLPPGLGDRVGRLARRLKMDPDEVVRMALELGVARLESEV